MALTDIYDLPQVQELDSMILISTCNDEVDRHEFKKLLEARKSAINKNLDFNSTVKILLDGFNETLRHELIKLRKETMRVFESVKALGLQGAFESVGSCKFGNEYPHLHPINSSRAKGVWEKTYQGWKDLYPTNPEQLRWHYHGDRDEMHNWMHGLEDNSQNHNGGLDKKATADMHITEAAEYLLTRTPFSILDMIYVREFDMNVSVRILGKEQVPETEDELNWSTEDYIKDEEESIRRYL